MNEDKQFVRIGEATKILGVSHSTIRRWTNSGKIDCKRLPSGQRVINCSQIIRDIKESKGDFSTDEIEKNQVIFYARVSSHRQKDDLERQRDYLQEKFKTKFKDEISKDKKTDYICIQDIASGLNFKRRGLIKILESVKKGRVRQVVVASKDRMARFGFDLIEWICSEYGTTIVVLDDENTTQTEELGKDLLSIIQIYCCKWNGSRRYKTTQKTNKDNETKDIPNLQTERNIESME
jgi:predicted site-specific integrase-resolvase